MSMGLPAYTTVGAGTLQATAGSSTDAPVVPHANTLAGDLVVVSCGYGTVAATRPVDLGDGWIIQSYITGSNTGALMAACIAPRAGSSGYAGIGLGMTNGNVCLQAYTYRVARPARFDLGRVGMFEQYSYGAASSTALDAPAVRQPYQQCIDLVGRVYWNNGTTTTVGNITNYAERFDTGSATPKFGVVLNDRTALMTTGAVQNASVTSALAAAMTDRFGFRMMIPIVGNTVYRGRMYGSRRLLG